LTTFSGQSDKAQAGLIMRGGTIVDATLIAAPIILAFIKKRSCSKMENFAQLRLLLVVSSIFELTVDFHNDIIIS